MPDLSPLALETLARIAAGEPAFPDPARGATTLALRRRILAKLRNAGLVATHTDAERGFVHCNKWHSARAKGDTTRTIRAPVVTDLGLAALEGAQSQRVTL